MTKKEKVIYIMEVMCFSYVDRKLIEKLVQEEKDLAEIINVILDTQ